MKKKLAIFNWKLKFDRKESHFSLQIFSTAYNFSSFRLIFVFLASLDELIKHALLALRDTLPPEDDLKNKVYFSSIVGIF